MNIAFINQWGRGGGVIWDLRIAEQLDDLGNNINFYIGGRSGEDQAHSLDDFDVVEVPAIDLADIAKAAPPGIGGVISDIGNYLFTRAASKKLDPSDFDIVHINSKIQFSRYVNTWQTPSVIKLNGPPYSFFYDRVHPFSTSCTHLNSFDAAVTTGITTEYVRERTDAPVTNINPGVDTETFVPRPTENSSKKTILFIGRFAPVKNLTLLVKSFKEIHEKYPNTELVLVGDGPLKDNVERTIKELKLSKSVRLPGYVSNEKLPQFYQESDIFALSSQHDNHPITILEAMSCGTPVVAPELGWIPQIITDRKEGLLYEPEHKEALSNAIEVLLTDQKLHEDLCKNGRRKAVTNFDWEQRAKKLQELYMGLI